MTYTPEEVRGGPDVSSAAYKAGQRACRGGRLVSDNPFRWSSFRKHRDWHAGWCSQRARAAIAAPQGEQG